MKKTLLLAGVASVFAFNANAVELLPYVGLDYNYSMLNHDEAVVVGEDTDANLIKDGVMAGQAHSASVVLGTKVTPYAGVEAFISFQRKNTKLMIAHKFRHMVLMFWVTCRSAAMANMRFWLLPVWVSTPQNITKIRTAV